KTGVVSATGDRRDEDVRSIGRYAGLMFDKIILKQDRDNRGRTKEQLTTLLMEGIREVNLNVEVTIVSDETEAIQYAIDSAKPGEFIFVCADDIPNILTYIQKQVDFENAPINLGAVI